MRTCSSGKARPAPADSYQVYACSRLHSIRATRSSALRAAFTGSAGFSTRPLPRTCDRRCPGQTDRDNPAPLTSNREGAASDWPQTPVRLLISQQPGWSLLQKRRLHPTNAAKPRGKSRGRSAGFLGSGVVLTDRTRLQRSEDHASPSLAKAGEASRSSRSQAPRPLETTVFGETMAKGGSAHQPQKACPAARGARQEGSEAGSRPFPRPKKPQARVRCPEGPSIKGPHRIGQSMFPGRPGSRVGRQKPWLRRQAQPRPTRVGNRTIRWVLVFVVSCRR